MSDLLDETTLLWAAIEDYAGLWELEWELNSLHPEKTDNRAQARDIAIRLLELGLVTVCFAGDPEADCVALARREARRVLQGDEWWQPPQSTRAPVVRISATAEGAAEYGRRTADR